MMFCGIYEKCKRCDSCGYKPTPVDRPEFIRYFMGCFFSFVPEDRNIKEYMEENEK